MAIALPSPTLGPKLQVYGARLPGQICDEAVVEGIPEITHFMSEMHFAQLNCAGHLHVGVGRAIKLHACSEHQSKLLVNTFRRSASSRHVVRVLEGIREARIPDYTSAFVYSRPVLQTAAKQSS